MELGITQRFLPCPFTGKHHLTLQIPNWRPPPKLVPSATLRERGERDQKIEELKIGLPADYNVNYSAEHRRMYSLRHTMFPTQMTATWRKEFDAVR
jgi:hypothetical protein